LIQFRDREIKNETITLSQAEVYFLGPNLTIRGCDVFLRVAAKTLVVSDCRFFDSKITVKKKLTNFRWHRAKFYRCQFSGPMSGCDFGEMEDVAPGVGGVESCDFSEAILDGCSFRKVDVRSVTFPKWPCFTVIEPRRHSAAIQAAPWPGMSHVIGKVLAESGSDVTAVTLSATELAKRYKVDLEQIRGAACKIPDVLL